LDSKVITRKKNLLEQKNCDVVILIGEDGSKFGEMNTEAAFTISEERNLDLVIVNEENDPPILKLMNYGKYSYNQKIKSRENNKKQKVIKNKEIRFTVSIDPHDLQTKSRQIDKFLSKGHRVRISILFPKRQKDTIKPAIESLVEDMKNTMEEKFREENKPTMSERMYILDIVPVK